MKVENNTAEAGNRRFIVRGIFSAFPNKDTDTAEAKSL